MTQQDDITQRVLTVEHHLNELMRLTQPWPNATIPCATVRSHVEQALSKLRAPVAEQAALFAQSTTKDDKAALGMLECGKPLCAPGEHHPLCRNGWAEKKGASAPTPKPWPVEEQPDGTVTPVDPVDLASAPVAGEAQPVAWRYQTPTGWHATTDAQKAVSLRAHHPVKPLYPAPQASAEYVRDTALSNLLWAASERDKGNRIRQFDQFMDEARAAISSNAAKQGSRDE